MSDIAVTQNIFRATNGGASQKGWAPQAGQLAAVAAANDVTAIVVSIGGNDLGFSDIIISCTEDWFTSPSWWENHCHDDEQANVDSRMPAAMAGVAKAIAEIRAVMAAAGDGDYRLVLRSYPSPIPRASENRCSESGWSRWLRSPPHGRLLHGQHRRPSGRRDDAGRPRPGRSAGRLDGLLPRAGRRCDG